MASRFGARVALFGVALVVLIAEAQAQPDPARAGDMTGKSRDSHARRVAAQAMDLLSESESDEEERLEQEQEEEEKEMEEAEATIEMLSALLG